MMTEPLDMELESIIIAVPITARIRRFCYGHFLGPCFMYYAEAYGVEEHGDSPKEAAGRLADILKQKFEEI